jgi:hypothetical protein
MAIRAAAAEVKTRIDPHERWSNRMDKTRMGRRLALALGTGALLVGTIAGPAFAADTVSQAVGAGTRTASVGDLTLDAVTTTHADQESAGSMTLTADDSTGSGAGWNVTIVSSDFVYSGSNGGTDIAASNFSLTSAAAPVATAGDAVDATNGPMVPGTSPVGTLDSARKTVQANASYGEGTYTQAIDVNLTVPAESRAGTYTGTLTTTIASAP